MSLAIATFFLSQAYAEVTLLNPDMLGINDDILDLQIGFNTNLDDADDDDSKYNNEDNDEAPIHLNMRR
jgi:hypothetical protein